MFDVILKGGEVFDGSGAQGVFSDVAISDGKIAEVGRLDDDATARVIDVTDLAVAPGLIDMHTHSDFTLVADGRAENQVHQGVTTEVVGQCVCGGNDQYSRSKFTHSSCFIIQFCKFFAQHFVPKGGV